MIDVVRMHERVYMRVDTDFDTQLTRRICGDDVRKYTRTHTDLLS